jgi:predicted GNAT family acetyltransferase
MSMHFSHLSEPFTRLIKDTRTAVRRGSKPPQASPGGPVEIDKLESVGELSRDAEAEVLSFLDEQPVHTVIMAGLIRDNGFDDTLNRGRFYGYRGPDGILEGVALVGHATLLEVRSERALVALAQRARTVSDVSFILGEQETMERFWNCYSNHVTAAHFRRKELLFEQRWASTEARPLPGLRCATAADVDLVVSAHAHMTQEELGFNPLALDAAGFRQRCERRIRQRRVWVLIKNGQLIFKVDVVTESDTAHYLEGVYVNPAERSKGYGTRCLMEISRRLLSRTQVLCLLISEQNRVAQGLARKAGYAVTSCYESIFLRQSGATYFPHTNRTPSPQLLTGL